jgi:hypothetical protein
MLKACLTLLRHKENENFALGIFVIIISMNARDFLVAYATAIYKTQTIAFSLTLEKNDTILFSARPFAIITAHNPHSQPLSKEENHKRHVKLQNLLQQKHFEIEESIGQSPDGTWQEEGFLIFDISLEEALELGQMFEQNAILYGQGNRVALAWCEGGLEWFYPKVTGFGFQGSEIKVLPKPET